MCNALSRSYGATAARLTPDQKVGSSNLSGLIFPKTTPKALSMSSDTSAPRHTFPPPVFLQFEAPLTSSMPSHTWLSSLSGPTLVGGRAVHGWSVPFYCSLRCKSRCLRTPDTQDMKQEFTPTCRKDYQIDSSNIFSVITDSRIPIFSVISPN